MYYQWVTSALVISSNVGVFDWNIYHQWVILDSLQSCNFANKSKDILICDFRCDPNIIPVSNIIDFWGEHCYIWAWSKFGGALLPARDCGVMLSEAVYFRWTCDYLNFCIYQFFIGHLLAVSNLVRHNYYVGFILSNCVRLLTLTILEHNTGLNHNCYSCQSL